MAIRVALNHRTVYKYDRSSLSLPQVVRLRPAPHCRTPIISYSLKVHPAGHFINWQQDPYSNYLARLVFPKPVKEFSVEVDLIAEMTTINPFDFFIEAIGGEVSRSPTIRCWRRNWCPISKRSQRVRLLGWSTKSERDKVRTIDYLVEINQRLQSMIGYIVRMEPGIQTCEETLTKRQRIVPRFGLAAWCNCFASRAGGAVCIGLPDPTDGRREVARWAFGSRARLHRSARLGGGVFARRRLDRPGPDERSDGRRRPYSARCAADPTNAAPDQRFV